MRTSLLIGGMLVGFGLWGPAAGGEEAKPAATQPATETAPAASVDPKVAAVLERLEERGKSVHDLQTKVEQLMKDNIVNDTIKKSGELKYLAGDAASKTNPRFWIHFAKIDQGGFPLKPETYVFDGRWFIEAKDATKTVIKREIVRPGETLDLFRVENSPFPLPFGQKKDEILANFDVTIAPLGKDDPAGTTHLLCVPKPGSSKATEYKELHFFVDPGLDLPVKIVAYRLQGTRVSEIHTVTFPGLSAKSINQGLAGSDFEYKPPRDWSIAEERLDAEPPPAHGDE